MDGGRNAFWSVRFRILDGRGFGEMRTVAAEYSIMRWIHRAFINIENVAFSTFLVEAVLFLSVIR